MHRLRNYKNLEQK